MKRGAILALTKTRSEAAARARIVDFGPTRPGTMFLWAVCFFGPAQKTFHMNAFFPPGKNTPFGPPWIYYLFPGLGWPAGGGPPEWDPKNDQNNKKTGTFKAIRAHFGVHFGGAPKRARCRPRALAGPPGQSVYFLPLVFFYRLKKHVHIHF